ncbi:hypothetical protein EJB05_38520, partial [Eragrostis curvula]
MMKTEAAARMWPGLLGSGGATQPRAWEAATFMRESNQVVTNLVPFILILISVSPHQSFFSLLASSQESIFFLVDLEPPCDEYKLAATGLPRLSCRARSTMKHLTRRAVAEVEENMSCTTAGSGILREASRGRRNGCCARCGGDVMRLLSHKEEAAAGMRARLLAHGDGMQQLKKVDA